MNVGVMPWTHSKEARSILYKEVAIARLAYYDGAPSFEAALIYREEIAGDIFNVTFEAPSFI